MSVLKDLKHDISYTSRSIKRDVKSAARDIMKDIKIVLKSRKHK